jgi:broad specificity phosphatase PhoE
MTAANNNAATHTASTLEHSKTEQAEHMEGMLEVSLEMRKRPLRIFAYSLDQGPPADAENVKTVHLVRHGQGFHNLLSDIFRDHGREWQQNVHSAENPYTMPEIVDAPLTEKGRQQALLLQSAVKALPHCPELVVLSPNCRAIQTGLLVFEELLTTTPEKASVPFVAHEMVREEFGVHVCDQRRPVSRQAVEFPQVDFSLLETDEDAMFRADARETKLQVGERGYRFLEWLARRPEKHVGIASHSAWLLTVLNGVCECAGEDADKLKLWFQTGEMRSVKLEFIYSQ